MAVRAWVLLLVLALVLGFASWLPACPFCSAVSQTLRQEIASMDAAVIAEAMETPTATAQEDNEGAIRLRVVKVLKGSDIVQPGLEIEAVYFGKVEKGRTFMLTGVDPPKLMWSSPLAVTERSSDYLNKILQLPDSSLERLKFYQEHLEDADPMLARDAYDEFAVAPYAEVQQLKPFMKHDQLLAWVQDSELPADRKRLYLTMLGICGSEKDVPALEAMLTSTQPSTRSGLDALIACYLNLKGPSGLDKIDQLFLADKTVEYADTYAAIQALRFHGTETDTIPRERLVKSLHHILERPDLADLVIPDLARWEDWSQIDRLVGLFKTADADNNWVRVPVVNYLRACPKPEAKEAIKELEQIDPASVRRANTFFPVPTPAPPPSPSTSARPQLGARYAAAMPQITGELAASELGVPSDNVANPMAFLCVLASAGGSLMIMNWLVLTG